MKRFLHFSLYVDKDYTYYWIYIHKFVYGYSEKNV